MNPKIYKIKEGKLEEWKRWCKEVSTTYKEAAEKTLSDEGVTYEGFIIVEIGGSYYSIGFGIVEGKKLLPVDSGNVLNKKHREMKLSCLEPMGEGEFSYLLKAQ